MYRRASRNSSSSCSKNEKNKILIERYVVYLQYERIIRFHHEPGKGHYIIYFTLNERAVHPRLNSHDSQPRRPHHDPPRPKISPKTNAQPTCHTITRHHHDPQSSHTITQHHHAKQSRPKPPPPKPNAPQKHQTEITPYNVSSRALAAILSPSLSVYFTSIGRYFFSSFTFPEDLAMRTRFLIAVRSSGLIFNTLL